MKRLYLIYIALLLCPAMLCSCTGGFLAKAAGVGADIMTEIFKDEQKPEKPVYAQIKFPTGIVIEEKPGFWAKLFGKKLRDTEFMTEVYLVSITYSDDYIYYQVRVAPSLVEGKTFIHDGVKWKIRKDSYKGKDIDEKFYLSDSFGEQFRIQRIETDDIRKTMITKLPITVQVK